MPLSQFTFPGKLGTNDLGATVTNEADLRALHVDRIRDAAEKRIYAASVVAKYFPANLVTGTSTTRIDAMGGGALQKLVHGQTPTPSEYKFGVSKFSIDTPVLARARIEELAEIQTHLPVLNDIGDDQGKKLAEFIDETYLIMAIKAGLLTQTPFSGVTAAEGFGGGSNITMAAAADRNDPAKLLNALRQLEMAMFKKNVDWAGDQAVLVVSPEVMFTLESNEMLVDRNIKWADGTNLDATVLKVKGIPVVRSNHFPGGRNITNHLLSNSSNQNAYNGDFSKVLGVVVSRKALQDGYAYKPKYTMHWDETDLCHYVTARVAMGVGIARPEFAGVITHA